MDAAEKNLCDLYFIKYSLCPQMDLKVKEFSLKEFLEIFLSSLSSPNQWNEG